MHVYELRCHHTISECRRTVKKCFQIKITYNRQFGTIGFGLSYFYFLYIGYNGHSYYRYTPKFTVFRLKCSVSLSEFVLGHSKVRRLVRQKVILKKLGFKVSKNQKNSRTITFREQQGHGKLPFILNTYDYANPKFTDKLQMYTLFS